MTTETRTMFTVKYKRTTGYLPPLQSWICVANDAADALAKFNKTNPRGYWRVVDVA